MSDSYIQNSQSGTAYVGPDAVQFFRAKSIRYALHLWHRTGLRPSRGVRLRDLIDAASDITGKKYPKRTSHIPFIVDDLEVWMSAMQSALPETSQ